MQDSRTGQEQAVGDSIVDDGLRREDEQKTVADLGLGALEGSPSFEKAIVVEKSKVSAFYFLTDQMDIRVSLITSSSYVCAAVSEEKSKRT